MLMIVDIIYNPRQPLQLFADPYYVFHVGHQLRNVLAMFTCQHTRVNAKAVYPIRDVRDQVAVVASTLGVALSDSFHPFQQ